MRLETVAGDISARRQRQWRGRCAYRSIATLRSRWCHRSPDIPSLDRLFPVLAVSTTILDVAIPSPRLHPPALRRSRAILAPSRRWRLPKDVAFGDNAELVLVRSGDVITMYPAGNDGDPTSSASGTIAR